MKREYFDTKRDGFYGAYYKNPKTCNKLRKVYIVVS